MRKYPGDVMRNAYRMGKWLPRAPLAALVGLALVVALAGCDVTAAPSFGTTSTSAGTVTTIPIQVTTGQDHSTSVLVPVYIKGQGPFSFILDTGASISLIDRQLARRLNLPRSGGGQPVVGVGGTEQVVMVQVDTWRVGSATLPAGSVAAGAVPSDRGVNGFVGLLGSDIWSQLGKIIIDYTNSTLTVYSQLASQNTTGARLPGTASWDIWRHAA
ncbi:MAG TPA: retropepsin-like aspartic protease [Ktedonobacterales bacterium]|nr:retropepsin-like aspartic protease [Ktedonobacterales bacterium]